MLGFRRVPIACRSRLKALRGLYARYYNENTPEVRGLRLLGAWLSPSQFEQFNAKAHFDVVGCATGRRYRIHYGTQANVHELDVVWFTNESIAIGTPARQEHRFIELAAETE